MKKIFNILMLSCMMIMASCSSDEEVTETAPQGSREVNIAVNIPDDASRVSLDGNKLVWNEGDQIYVIPLNEDGSANGAACTLNLLLGAGTQAGRFTGLITDSPKYKLVYKTDKVTIDKQGKVSMDYSAMTQYGLDNEDHLKDHFLITSSVITKEQLAGVVPMNLDNAVLRVNLRSLPENLLKVTEVKWILNYGEADETVAGTLKFKGELPVMYAAEADRYITIPLDVTKNLVQHAGKKMALQFTNSDHNLKNFDIVRTVTVTVPAEKTYTASKRYNINVSLAAQEGQKAMTEWDTENDYPLGGQIWAKVGEGGKFCVENTIIESKSLRGYHVYTSYLGHPLNLIDKCFTGSVNIVELVLPRVIQTIHPNAFDSTSGINCRIDLSMCKNLSDISSNVFSGSKNEILLPLNGVALTINYNAFDSYAGTSLTIPKTTAILGDKILNNAGIQKLVLLFSYKGLTAYETPFAGCPSQNIDLTLNKEWIKPMNTGELRFTIEQLTPTKTRDGKYMWMGMQWKSIRFVEVNADGTPGSEVQAWAEGNDIDDNAGDDNPQNGGALTSTGKKK